MRSRLALHGIESHIVYQGIDFDKWKPDANRQKDLLVGTVYRTEAHYNSDAINDFAFHSAGRYKIAVMHNSDDMELFYQTLQFYLAPQTLGGLSNPPMEAALCGAMIVCPGIEESGLSDYCTKETAIIYNDISDVPDLLDAARWDWWRVSNMKWLLHDKIKSRADNMKKFVEYLEKSL
jgi:hypothetical protein